MKKVKKVLLVILAVVVLLGSFAAGYVIAANEGERQARIQQVALRNNEYRQIIANIPAIQSSEDRLFLIDILNQGPTEYWDQDWVFTYKYSYTYEKEDGTIQTYEGKVENASWRTMMADITANDEVWAIEGSSAFGREVL